MATKEAVKHTPGPWHWLFDADGDHLIYAEKCDVLAVTGGEGYLDLVTDEANARVIAAGPEMLEALKAALAELGDYSDEHDGQYAIRPETEYKIAAAIQKAEGRQ